MNISLEPVFNKLCHVIIIATASAVVLLFVVILTFTGIAEGRGNFFAIDRLGFFKLIRLCFLFYHPLSLTQLFFSALLFSLYNVISRCHRNAFLLGIFPNFVKFLRWWRYFVQYSCRCWYVIRNLCFGRIWAWIIPYCCSLDCSCGSLWLLSKISP